MPPAVKRRKIVPSATRKVTAPTVQQGIQAFGKISKSQSPWTEKKPSGTPECSEDAFGKCVLGVGISKKRKVESIQDPADKQEEVNNEQAPPTQNDSTSAGLSLVSCPKQPKVILPSLSNTETPTKGARSCLESLAFASSSPPSLCSSPVATSHGTPPSSPIFLIDLDPQNDEDSELPDELLDLINLHSSFLTALSLHYAHNGSMTPADLRNLEPSIERAWRKRRVAVDDVRKILAIERKSCGYDIGGAGTLFLSDYGHSKICVEIADIRNGQRRPINEEALNALFLKNLKQQWTTYKTTPSTATLTPSTFVSNLPLLPITPCISLSKIAPLLSKGQRRLEDLKAGAIRAQQQKRPNTSSANTLTSTLQEQKAKQKATARSTDLLSRIKAKQYHQSTLPPPPSAGVLAWKAALQRIAEVAPVLESLAVASAKHVNDDASADDVAGLRATHVSFTMPTLVQHLQMSLRNPIGKEEASNCIKALAEVAAEWVAIREVGKIVSVTVRGLGLARVEMAKRVSVLMERL